MAQRVQTLLIDDLDGGEAEGTVRFGLDGAEYEIDLSAEHAGALRWALAPYVRAARRAPGAAAGRPGRGGRGAAGAGAADPVAVREWAKSQGIEVKDPGAGADRAGREVQGGHGAVAHGFGPGEGTAALKQATTKQAATLAG